MKTRPLFFIIPVRSGSKRFPGKNTKILMDRSDIPWNEFTRTRIGTELSEIPRLDFEGLSLTDWAVLTAYQYSRSTEHYPVIIVSSDSIKDLKQHVRVLNLVGDEQGDGGLIFNHLRSAETSDDQASSADAVNEIINAHRTHLSEDMLTPVILWQATNPIRSVFNIDRLIETAYELGPSTLAYGGFPTGSGYVDFVDGEVPNRPPTTWRVEDRTFVDTYTKLETVDIDTELDFQEARRLVKSLFGHHRSNVNHGLISPFSTPTRVL